ncbi:MAG: altronate dehydratase family protein [Abditibacteriales bacterium]|nr:altronate dehydratase family protein [Abditibacteriales bacterium]MDW8366125.1 altronate dehydratase family protein [Abditibacteriales bacterium]
MPEFELTDKAIVLHEGDDVAIAKEKLTAGTVLTQNGWSVQLRQDVPAGHKIALHAVKKDAPLRRYGQVIGFATEDIQPGDWVHLHNLGMGQASGAHAQGGLQVEYEFGTEVKPVDYVPVDQMRTFRGYQRPDGRVGTRNYVALIATVNCAASTTQIIADHFKRTGLKEFPHVDGVLPITHKGGCGTAMGGADLKQLQRTLAGFANHPNVAAYLLIGLGCETNQALAMLQDEGLGLIPIDAIRTGRPQLPPVLTIQEIGGIQKTAQRGIAEVYKLLRQANECRRTEQPISALVVGTNCGGSDGNSGITANPALGVAGDELVRYGGTWLIAETTETYGAEHLLTKRAVSREVGEKLIERIKWWEWYTGIWGVAINNNPSAGNKEGGLTTIYEKSLGAVAKGGTSPLVYVYEYAERIRHKGFCFMDTPGLDNPSVTGLVAGGCTLIVFTTGRGSVLGCKPSPCIKVATNTPLYNHMIDDMDINAGVILEGVPLREVGLQIFEEIIAVASGKKTKSEAQGLGEEEFTPWVLGPVL